MYPTNVLRLPSKAELFYKNILRILQGERTDFLIGGSLALAYYMHLPRMPKDMDIFLTRADCERVLLALRENGYRAEVLHPHWLAKVYNSDMFIDFIFSSGNGVAQVKEDWFTHARTTELFGMSAKICAPEDIFWSKAFIMERERFDGADIAHLIRDAGDQFDWARLLKCFAEHWRVLMSHLLLFQYMYPSERTKVPVWVMDVLMMRLSAEGSHAPSGFAGAERVCKGTLLSRDQYLSDIELLGYTDGRLPPHGTLSENEISQYTEAFRAIQAKEESARKRRKERVA